jgi:S-adenosylmethionine hydrolase
LTGLAVARFTVALGAVRIPGIALNYSYSSATASADGFVAVINSWGLLEIAVYLGNAQRRTGARIGDQVKITIATESRRR